MHIVSSCYWVHTNMIQCYRSVLTGPKSGDALVVIGVDPHHRCTGRPIWGGGGKKTIAKAYGISQCEPETIAYINTLVMQYDLPSSPAADHCCSAALPWICSKAGARTTASSLMASSTITFLPYSRTRSGQLMYLSGTMCESDVIS